jgi:hypothetical protein
MGAALANVRPMAQRKIRALSSSAAGIAGTVEPRERNGPFDQGREAWPPVALLYHLRSWNKVERDPGSA